MIIGMNKQLFKQLCMNYNKEPDRELYELWEYNLRCYDEDEMQKAINIIMSNDKFFPTLNRILEVVKDVVLKEIFIKDKTKYKNTEWFSKENSFKDEKMEDEEFKNFIDDFRNI